ncbi:hypothetical protein DL769_007930 [Monosporascus sp. CRB-8-3]|nr:hypothetical protein DL769_007930 [Monosporascus sp. CRB-8-3]
MRSVFFLVSEPPRLWYKPIPLSSCALLSRRIGWPDSWPDIRLVGVILAIILPKGAGEVVFHRSRWDRGGGFRRGRRAGRQASLLGGLRRPPSHRGGLSASELPGLPLFPNLGARPQKPDSQFHPEEDESQGGYQHFWGMPPSHQLEPTRRLRADYRARGREFTAAPMP